MFQIHAQLYRRILNSNRRYVTVQKNRLFSKVAPSAASLQQTNTRAEDFIPPDTLARLTAAKIDLSKGYPVAPSKNLFFDEAYSIRDYDRPYIDPGSRADKSKSALFSAAKDVIDLTPHIGTEVVGLQLKDLNDKQKDELALLCAERSVVFFRDQDLSPQEQKKVTAHFGEIEVHPQVPHVPGVPGVIVVAPDRRAAKGKTGAFGGKTGNEATFFRNPGGASSWHTDLVHERQPAGITHLHNDTIPSTGGDTTWASGYSAYEKLSPEFRKMIEGKLAVFISAHSYPDRHDGSLKRIERAHPLVRIHPATGWKSLFVNRAFTTRIVGLDKAESDLILNYLFDVYEKSLDIQVRFKWTPRTSALWDNRISIHNAIWDYEDREPRHGTRVASLAEKPFFDANAPTRREALGLITEAER